MQQIRKIDTTGRHAAVQEICSFFRYDHLGNPVVADVSRIFFEAAEKLLSQVDDGPMLTRSLNSLWEAKNSGVAQCVSDLRALGEMQ